MNGRRRQIILVGLVTAVIAIVLWIFLPVGVPKTDEAKYERWRDTSRLFGRAMWWERHLPPILAQQFNLRARGQKYISEHSMLGDALVESGYLTNFPIAVTNAPLNGVMCSNIVQEMRKVFEGRDEWELSVRSNTFVFWCRPQDVVLCSHAIAAVDRVSTNITTGVGLLDSPK